MRQWPTPPISSAPAARAISFCTDRCVRRCAYCTPARVAACTPRPMPAATAPLCVSALATAAPPTPAISDEAVLTTAAQPPATLAARARAAAIFALLMDGLSRDWSDLAAAGAGEAA